MANEFFINLGYRCNERCVFCAADVALDHKPRNLGVREIVDWLHGRPIGEGDTVFVAGGEPTLHPEFLAIVSLLAGRGGHVLVFTNGLRLADPAFSKAAVDAGVRGFEIALFGRSAAAHDAITQRRNSHALTVAALKRLCTLKRTHAIRVVLRLLVSRQSVHENTGIVAEAHETLPALDGFSLNRLILSESARTVDASISWREARRPVNETVTLARRLGRAISVDVPLCVLDADNLAWVLREQTDGARAGAPRETVFHYLDPDRGDALRGAHVSTARRTLPDVCMPCRLRPVCGRVEGWYIRRFGVDGLATHTAPTEPVAA